VSARIEFASHISTDVDYAARTFGDGLNTESTGNGDSFVNAKNLRIFVMHVIGGMGCSLSSPPTQHGWDYTATIFGFFSHSGKHHRFRRHLDVGHSETCSTEVVIARTSS
jgi:hypothetical protein